MRELKSKVVRHYTLERQDAIIMILSGEEHEEVKEFKLIECRLEQV